MLIACRDEKTALTSYFHYYFYKLRVGLVTAIEGSPHLKSGVGKSYTAIRIGELLDKDYKEGTTALDKIIFKPRDFVKAMDILESNGKIGQIISIDEAGILVNAKKWHTFVNRAISDAVMTFRNLRSMAIFVTPMIGIIDKEIRFFVSHLGICDKEVQAGDKPAVKLKLFRLYWDELRNKFYKYRITMWVNSRNKLVTFPYFYVQFPENKELIEAYEKKVSKYKSEIRRGIIQLEKIEKGYKYYVEDILEKKELIHDTKQGKRVYWDEIQEYYGLGQVMSKIIARRVNEILAKGGENGV